MSHHDISILRIHVRIKGVRTSISIDPDLFRALSYKLGGADNAKTWLRDQANIQNKPIKSMSRYLQSQAALLLAGLLQSEAQPTSPQCVKNNTQNKDKQNFTSDNLPI